MALIGNQEFICFETTQANFTLNPLGIFMPTVLRVGRYQFYFFSNEGQEPSHIHIKADGDQEKFWLEPIELAANYGFKGHELNEIKEIIEENQTLLPEAWYEHFGQN